MDWYSVIYKSFIWVSIILFLLSFNTTGETSYGSLMTSYSTLTIAILMIMIQIFKNIIKTSDSFMSQLYNLLLSTGPFLLMFGTIGLILYLLILYKDKIINERVSSDYISFRNASSILLLLQIYILFTNINNDSFANSGKISNVTTSLLYLIGVITSICALILYAILKYYTTDG